MSQCRFIMTNAEKRPVDAAGKLIDHTDPANWMTEEDADALAKEHHKEVAVVLTENDPLVCVDIDNCYDPETQEWDDRAKKWFKALNGCYVELSRSGRGVHFFGVAEQGLGEIYYNRKDGVEFYEKDRYIISGTFIQGDRNVDITSALKANLTLRETANGSLPDEGPVPEYTGPSDDNELIQMALNSKGGAAASFGDAPRFVDLWNGDEGKLARFYPTDTEGEPFNRSLADGALCAQLAFWTGKDVARTERLWLASPLAQQRTNREKLDRLDYRERTVRGAAVLSDNVYSKPREASEPPAAAVLPGTDVPLPTQANSGYMTIFEQDEHFKDCVYVRADDKILVPDGELLDAKRFKTDFGGYEFQMQPDGGRPTRDAWEAFTLNRCKRFPIAKHRGFMPNEPFGTIIDDRVNMYVPPSWKESDADVSPFLTLLQVMIPNERDRTILLSWMSSMVQNPGVKFQWAMAIQGAEGNGKTFVLSALSHAIGVHNTHLPNPEDMNEKYNDYLRDNLLIGVEEVHMNGRRDLLDRLKKYITGRRIEVRAMHSNKVMVDNLTNWMFLTNYKDAVIKTRNDRRYCIIFCAQQSEADVYKAGMGGTYWPQMWDWARAGGFDAIATYLSRYDIPEDLDPAGKCHRAPETTSTAEAITESYGKVEQFILEAINENEQGFRGGWVSSIMLGKLMDRHRIKITPRTLNQALETLGYTRLSTYYQGRSPKGVFEEDTRRPSLYVLIDMDDGSLDIDDYCEAQGYSSMPPAPKKDPA